MTIHTIILIYFFKFLSTAQQNTCLIEGKPIETSHLNNTKSTIDYCFAARAGAFSCSGRRPGLCCRGRLWGRQHYTALMSPAVVRPIPVPIRPGSGLASATSSAGANAGYIFNRLVTLFYLWKHQGAKVSLGPYPVLFPPQYFCSVLYQMTIVQLKRPLLKPAFIVNLKASDLLGNTTKVRPNS
jgi:hypothetical protein